MKYGSGDCILGLSIPSVINWGKQTGTTLKEREEILHWIGKQLVIDMLNSGAGYYKIEGDWLNIYTRAA